MLWMLYQPSDWSIGGRPRCGSCRRMRPRPGPSARRDRISVQALCGPDVLEHLVPAEQLEELHGVGRPAGDVARQLLEHRQRALAPPVVDGLGDVCPDAHGDGRPEVRPAQVREELGRRVGRGDPARVEQRVVGRRGRRCTGSTHGRGRLDEEVVPELLDVLVDERGLVGDDAQQRPQREAELGVPLAIHSGHQVVEALPVWSSGTGCTPILRRLAEHHVLAGRVDSRQLGRADERAGRNRSGGEDPEVSLDGRGAPSARRVTARSAR